MKKNILLKISALLVVPVLFYFVFQGFTTNTETSGNTASTAPAPTGGRDFQNVIYNWNVGDIDTGEWITSPVQLPRYRELNFTGVHLYDHIIGGPNDGTSQYGIFNVDLNVDPQVIPNIQALNTAVNSQNLSLYFERCKISKLCYAQRLIYEVSQGGSTTVNDGFCYQNCGGEYITEQDGRTVLHASDPLQQYPNGYWLAQNIYENLQHGDWCGFNPQHADTATWFVKPMMRIDSNIAHNQPNVPVIRIEVINYSNQQIKIVNIRAGHFLDQNGHYGGEYIDKFSFTGDTALQVIGGGGINHTPPELNDGQAHYLTWPDTSHVDFKVYWLGQVECWFDKMTVDDMFANGLFKGSYDFHIIDESTPENFLITALMIKSGKFSPANYKSVNYVMNVMYGHLQHSATPISLK